MKIRTKTFLATLSTAFIGAIVNQSVSALTFQQDIGVSFTFNSSLSINLSSADLIISNLAPGTSNDSNIIDVTVNSNNTNGYTLNATVGNSTKYDTRNLVHKNTNIPNTFQSVDYGSSIATNANLDPNKWAYAYLDTANSNTTWSNYSGLPQYNDENHIATLKTTTGPSSSDDIVKFKIAAKAANDQASGEYNNVINFEVVARTAPVTLYDSFTNAGKTLHNGYYALQDMNTNICDAAEVIGEGSQMQAIDLRDNKTYWITKLADNKCWMTQNLDFDIGAVTLTHNSTTLYHDDTDLGYGTSTNQAWTPDNATHATNVTTWSDLEDEPESYDPGNKIWDGTFGNYSVSTMPQGTNAHYHLGNYYNWTAAVAMNDTSSISGLFDADQSICPANWTLPKETGSGSFANLVNQYNYNNQSMTNPHIYDSPLYFGLSGRILSTSTNATSIGGAGMFWSSNIEGDYPVTYLDITGVSSVNPNGIDDGARDFGYSVRCVSR